MLGVALDVYPFVYWGVLSAYIGLSWAAPGALLGLAAAQRAERAGGRLINTVGITVGVVTAIALLVVVASLIDAAGAESESSGQTSVPVQTDSLPARPKPDRATIVTDAARRAGDSKITKVSCGEGVLATCAVTFAGPACQLWIVSESEGEVEAIPLAAPVEGARGSVSSGAMLQPVVSSASPATRADSGRTIISVMSS